MNLEQAVANLTPHIRAAIDHWLLAEHGAVPAYDDSTSLLAIGVDSIAALSIAMDLEQQLGLTIGDDLFFNHPTVASLSAALAVQRAGDLNPLEIRSNSVRTSNPD